MIGLRRKGLARRATSLACFAVIIGAAALLSAQANAYSVVTRVVNEFGYISSDLFDAGDALLMVDLVGPLPRGKFCTPARLERTGSVLRVTLTVDAGEPDRVTCTSSRSVLAGTLSAGAYSVETVLVDNNGTLVQRADSNVEVKERGAVCGLTPDDNLLQLHFHTKDAGAFVGKFNSDPAFRASLGEITIHEPVQSGGQVVIPADHPPLADLLRVWTALNASPDVDYTTRYGASYGCSSTCVGDRIAVAVEYYNAGFDRYFFTHEEAEIARLDGPSTSGGWSRTGESWHVVSAYGQNKPKEGVVQKIYRFWSADVSGKPSHFFTVDQRECAQLRDGKKKNWVFEGTSFWAHVPTNGACAAGTGAPLYRVYNNSIGGAPSHRFATRTTVVEQMVAKGWTTEGVAMCTTEQ